MKQIPLRNRKGDIIDHALVDDDQYEDLMRFKWYKTHYGYAARTLPRVDGQRASEWMHLRIYERLIGPVQKDHLDHEDRNRLNNQIANLREATTLENNLNRTISSRNTTGYVGVREDKRNGRYQAVTSVDDQAVSICYMTTARDAAIARDIYLTERHSSEFLALNVPDVGTQDIARVKSLMQAPKQRRGQSRYTGVSFESRRSRWVAEIRENHRRHYIGAFSTEDQAARAWDAKVVSLSLDRKLNFPTHAQPN